MLLFFFPSVGNIPTRDFLFPCRGNAFRRGDDTMLRGFGVRRRSSSFGQGRREGKRHGFKGRHVSGHIVHRIVFTRFNQLQIKKIKKITHSCFHTRMRHDFCSK